MGLWGRTASPAKAGSGPDRTAPDGFEQAVRVALGGGALEAIEQTVLAEAMASIAAGGRRREICVAGLSVAQIGRLEEVLRRRGVAARYQPMVHHYRAPSSPARLVLDR